MAEWSIAPASKAGGPKGSGGSTPSPSATVAVSLVVERLTLTQVAEVRILDGQPHFEGRDGTMFEIKDHIRDGRRVRFVRANAGNLWYVTELGFEFPVPFEDMGNATFLAEDKAMLFMRYIRKHSQAIEAGRQPG
jgi:hypothetical protein